MLDKTRPLIYLITEGKLTEENFSVESNNLLDTVKFAVSIGIPLVQIREKKLPARLLFHLVREIVAFRKEKTKVLVNERLDIAIMANADGIHLPSDAVPVQEIRKKLPRNLIIGVSCHSKKECVQAMKAGADFVTLSPIFYTPQKGKPKGLEVLSEIAKELAPFPVIGLGGINQENYRQVLNAASGFAAIRFLNDKSNLESLYEKGLLNNCGN